MHDRICGVRLQNKNDAVFNIFNVYMPARGCEGDLSTTLDELSGILENTELGSTNIVGGDFNGDMGIKGGQRGVRKCTKEGTHVFDFMTRHNFYAANLDRKATGAVDTFYGPKGSSCIDYLLIPIDMQQSFISCTTHDCEALNTSDHNPVTITLDIGSVEKNTNFLTRNKKLLWNKITPEKLQEEFTSPVEIEVQKIITSLSDNNVTTDQIDSAITQVIEIIKSAEKVIPKTCYKSHIKPYWSPALNELKKQKILRYREWCDADRPRDLDNSIRITNCAAKKAFRTHLKLLAKSYEEEKINEAVRKAEIDKTGFWRMLRKTKENNKISISAIKNQNGKAVHDINQISDVWKSHFSGLCTPKEMPKYNEAHYRHVCNEVQRWAEINEGDDFSTINFTKEEVRKTISKLNSGKSPGFDGITKEHLKAAGECIVEFLFIILSSIFQLEYIPENFRRGTQVPLYKGKNTSILDPNNYRGITLLTTFNKIFEILMWSRIEGWWVENKVIEDTQGACRKGVSSLHSALLLQETIAANLENNRKVYVVYLDVSKAFDRVWIEGLFYQLRKIGIKGKTWRLLYKCYKGFLCRARVHNSYSEWYEMKCGIHQGGYLSLVKYITFINSLLTELKDTNLCCTIHRIKSSPIGYADDMV